MFKTKVVENIKTYILCLITSFFCAIHKMSHMERARQDADDSIIWCMFFACWIHKAGDTHSDYVIRFNAS
jgi:hypothetical protein